VGTSQRGNTIRVREAQPGEILTAARVTAEAFGGEGFTRHLFDLSTPRVQERLAREITMALALKWHAGDTFLVALDGEAVIGAAVVKYPGQRPRTRRWRLLAQGVPRLVGILTLVRWVRWRRVWPTLKAKWPPKGLPKPHAVLVALAVKPEHQGKGVARRLLDAVHAQGDGAPSLSGTYLLTGDLRNRQIYARFGYELLAENPAGQSFTSYQMFRRRCAAGAPTLPSSTPGCRS